MIAKPFINNGYKVIGGKNVPYLIIEVNQCGYDFFKSALYRCGVVGTPGEAFRANNCIRISLFTILFSYIPEDKINSIAVPAIFILPFEQCENRTFLSFYTRDLSVDDKFLGLCQDLCDSF